MDKTIIVRHFLASLAYHATKAIRDAPTRYPELDIGHGIRTPRQILHHITGVLSYAHSFYEHYDTTYFPDKSWKEEVAHFYETLRKLDKSMAENSTNKVTIQRLLQGPLSDAMAHTGQLLMLRRFAGSPVPAENFLMADIRVGIVGPNQADPVAPNRK
jgi:hypothetical protein